MPHPLLRLGVTAMPPHKVECHELSFKSGSGTVPLAHTSVHAACCPIRRMLPRMLPHTLRAGPQLPSIAPPSPGSKAVPPSPGSKAVPPSPGGKAVPPSPGGRQYRPHLVVRQYRPHLVVGPYVHPMHVTISQYPSLPRSRRGGWGPFLALPIMLSAVHRRRQAPYVRRVAGAYALRNLRQPI